MSTILSFTSNVADRVVDSTLCCLTERVHQEVCLGVITKWLLGCGRLYQRHYATSQGSAGW